MTVTKNEITATLVFCSDVPAAGLAEAVFDFLGKCNRVRRSRHSVALEYSVGGA